MVGTMTAGFKYRILVADDDEEALRRTVALLAGEGYVVLTARDGFEALAELRGGTPEIIIAELKMPNMSGFELLGIVRKRFPGVGVIARSGEFTPAGLPVGLLADRFVDKGENSDFELLERVRELLAEAPIRSVQARPESVPTRIPRDQTGYIVITCPSCLRSFSVRVRDMGFGSVLKDSCLHCGADVTYRIDRTVSGAQQTFSEKMDTRLKVSHRAIKDSKELVEESKKRIANAK